MILNGRSRAFGPGFFILGGMKRIVSYLIASALLISSCSESSPESSPAPQIDSSVVPSTDSTLNTEIEEKLPCLCNSQVIYFEDIEPFVFVKGDQKNSSKLEALAKDQRHLEVKYLELKGYDSIPVDFYIFENLQHITFRDSRTLRAKNLENLTEFKALQSLGFKMSQIKFDGPEDWMTQIKHLYGRKTQLKSLQSFTWFPRLISLDFETSGFTNFPSGIDSLNCIQFINFFETREDINQSEWNFENALCLEYYDFYTSYNTLRGVPYGLLEKELNHYRIKENGLTEEEKSRNTGIKKK